ncbi:hypothetical protein RUM44_004213 [Polyplax serrata]|uniref:PLD phosphodiesterase domain-containing protein n=1 Tax=Polyplax serrata TaxID=468196 RepID=A0ABR1B265_POLSC
MVGYLVKSKTNKEDTKNFENLTINNVVTVDEESNNRGGCMRGTKWWHFSCIPIFASLILIFLVILLPTLDEVDLRMQFMLNKQVSANQDNCSFNIVESIPEGLIYTNYTITNPSTFEVWKNLIRIAEHTIEIGSFYWSLSKSKSFPTESSQGDEIYQNLLNAGVNRNITIKIAQNVPSKSFPATDVEYLIQKKAAEVKFLNFDVFFGSGILHTKFWIVDRKHLYLGSANLDWRALTQARFNISALELGIVFYNCSSVAEDLGKIFDVYWMVGNQTTLPKKWPDSLNTIYNFKNPFNIDVNGEKNSFYISSSPPQFSPEGRTDDLVALLKVIKQAKEFIHISVMEYMPLIEFGKHKRFWPDIDNALRKAVVENNVKLRLLISQWKNTKPIMIPFLKSLLALNNVTKNAVVEIKWFKVNANSSQAKIPYARVNHNKYMVTDSGGFIGTSNWSGDYFMTTAGVSVVSHNVNGSANAIQKELNAVFERDWNSTFAYPLLK